MWLPLDLVRKIRRCGCFFLRNVPFIRKHISAFTREFIIVSIDCIRPFLGPKGCCRFYPTCSVYARQELEKGPLFRACWRIILRLGQCHPFGHFLRSRMHIGTCCHQEPPMLKENGKDHLADRNCN